MALRHHSHLLPDDLPDLSADVRVDLVENQSLGGLESLGGLGSAGLERQHHAGDFAGTRDCGEGARRFAGIRLEHVDDPVHAVRLRLDRLERHEELRLQKAQVLQLRRHRLRQLLRRRTALLRQLRARRPHRLVRHGDLRLQLRHALLAMLQGVKLRLLGLQQLQQAPNP